MLESRPYLMSRAEKWATLLIYDNHVPTTLFREDLHLPPNYSSLDMDQYNRPKSIRRILIYQKLSRKRPSLTKPRLI